MTTDPISGPVDALFIAFENQDNLGVRSLMSVLAEAGYRSVLVPFVPGLYDYVIEEIQRVQPRLIGFSIIFQYSIEDFNQLAHRLRLAGIQAHFTAGGHFPSIRPAQVMELMPDLDSVVCFEGEYTLLELLQHLSDPAAWSKILGLAYPRDGQVLVNPPRPLIANLDELPRLERGAARELSYGVRTASMLASRGCLYDCAFCSIRLFYHSAPGSLRRTRSPAAVVAEMVDLYQQDGVRFFNFQDDDFAARTLEQRRWLNAFLEELARCGLKGKVIWKIACRVDDVETEIMQRCQAHGLVGVYLGVESGNPVGLKTLNKHVSVEQNAAAIQTLQDLGISFEMGFMLFDPSSTIETVAQNIHFLKEMMSDGAAPVNFCKMLPYAGTPIEAQLKLEGRLRGSISQPDYPFLDPRLDIYAHFVHVTFQKRNFKYSGLVERLCTCLFDIELARLSGNLTWTEGDQKELHRLVSQVNRVALDTLQAALDFIACRDLLAILNGWSYLNELTAWEQQQEVRLAKKLNRIMSRCNPELNRQMDLLYQKAERV
jgi:radical SAM superfamily enzyme YgiQ (UPF0313 family)